MAEILGIVAGSIQLADVALKIGENIYKFVDLIKTAPKKVATFRRDLDQTLDLLRNIQTLLETAKTKYHNIGESAKLVESVIKDFNRELAEILISVERIHKQSRKWKSKVLIGFKGDGEWVRIDDRLKMQYSELIAASSQLSIDLELEHGERLTEIGGAVTAISVEITQNVSTPIQDIKQEVQTIRTTGDASFLLIQEHMALQTSHMALQTSHMDRVEQFHGENMQRVTEIRDKVVFNQAETQRGFMKIENACNSISDKVQKGFAEAELELANVSDRIDKLEQCQNSANGITGPAIMAVVTAMKAVHLRPTSKNDRIRFEAQRKKMTVLIRRIIKLAEGPMAVKLLKGDDADEYTDAMQGLLDILRDHSDIENVLKQEMSKITLHLLGANSMYIQKAPDHRLKMRLDTQEHDGERKMAQLENPTIEHSEVSMTHAVEDGTLVVSSRCQRRVAMSPFGETDEMENSRTTVQYNPDVAPGETKTAFAALFLNTSGTLGSASVPLLLRVYNRRCYSVWDNDSPRHLASNGNLKRLQELLSSGQISVYDTDEIGSSLLHTAAGILRYRDKVKQGLAPGCFAVCKFLLDQGADANVVDDLGRTPLSYLATTVFESNPTYVDVTIARAAFEEILKSGIDSRTSPFGPEYAIASLIRGLMAGTSWFFDQLLAKLNTTEFDINYYAGSYNAVMLEFAAANSEDEVVLFRNCDIAIKRGGDITARTWDTRESCLHLLLRQLAFKDDDPFVKSEPSWQSCKKYLCRTFTSRLDKMLKLGADVYATDSVFVEFADGTHFGRSVTRAMYEYEVQDIWWDTIRRFGFERETVLMKEAEEVGLPVVDYEIYLESLSKTSFEARQRGFEERRLRPVQDTWMVPDTVGELM